MEFRHVVAAGDDNLHGFTGLDSQAKLRDNSLWDYLLYYEMHVQGAPSFMSIYKHKYNNNTDIYI